MLYHCPVCSLESRYVADDRTTIRFGSFKRKSDQQQVFRFRCLTCKKTFSTATSNPCYRQKKRHKNLLIRHLFCSGVSQRQISRVIKVARKTAARKLVFLGLRAEEKLLFENRLSQKSNTIEFDDLETMEHTKLKPLSVTLAVEYPTRRILGFKVSQMPANGLLAAKSVKKYGIRKDERTTGRNELFYELTHLVEPTAKIKSDSNPHYPGTVKKYFPLAEHITVIGKRGAVTGQGELKKTKFDPIFRLNHTCAMLRYHMSRLIRKTWCTTKKRRNLELHLAIYAQYHNERIRKKQLQASLS